MITSDDISSYLMSKGVKPSYQRLKIFDYLNRNHNHPTADMIHSKLSKEISTLSKTTVYNTLKLFVKNKVAIIVSTSDNESRYDLHTRSHGHFQCTECGEIYDFKAEFNQWQVAKLDGFQVEEQQIYFKGICKKCRDKSSKNH